MDSIIDDISNIILSQSQITDKDDSFKQDNIELLDNELKTPLTDTKVKDKEKLSIRNKQRKRSNNIELSKKISGLSTKTSLATNTSETVERLMSYKKNTQKKLVDMIKEKEEQEQEELKPKPQISIGSLKLIEGKQHLPIYSEARIKQIELEKGKKMEKLRKEVEKRRRKAEEEDIANSVPSYKGSEITNVKLCFDPESIKPIVYQTTKTDTHSKVTTEDEELKYCSFKPTTNKNSNIIFAKKNQLNKSVVERLTDSMRCKESMVTTSTKQRVKRKSKQAPKFVQTENNDLDRFIQSVFDKLAKPDEINESSISTSMISKYID
jgi:hypothetical protein